MLLLFSMFAFALVFHAVTRPEAALEARFNTATPVLQASIDASAPGAQGAQSTNGAQAIVTRVVLSEPVDLTEPAAVAEPVTLAPAALVATVDVASFAALAAAVAPAPLDATGAPASPGPGALTRAFSQGGASLRTAFKKAF